MTLPTSGPISASMINAELGRDPQARFHLNGAAERALAGVPTGLVTFADFYGKSLGFPTPQADYPDPVVVSKSVAWDGPTTKTASITFDSPGTLTVDGTPDEVMPTYWYQSGVPPAGYKLLCSFVSVTITNDTDDIDINYQASPFWMDLGGGIDFGAWVQIRTSIVPAATVTCAAVYDISLSDGSAVIVTFRATVSLSVTP